MFVITMYFEGPKEDLYCQLGPPRKIKNLLTYLLTYINKRTQLKIRLNLLLAS